MTERAKSAVRDAANAAIGRGPYGCGQECGHLIQPGRYHGQIIGVGDGDARGWDVQFQPQYGDGEFFTVIVTAMIITLPELKALIGQGVTVTLGDYVADDTWARLVTAIETAAAPIRNRVCT